VKAFGEDMEMNIFQTPQALARAAAHHFVQQCERAVAQSNGFAVALSGGTTPKLLYELLADPHEPYRDRIAWKKCFFFFTDERHVPPDHPESNYRMAWEALFSRVPKTQIIRMSGEKPAEEAAQEYEDGLWEMYGPEMPDLDLVLLGLGEDGHTASLFPGSRALQETERLVVAPWVEKLNAYRITMTLPVLNNGHSVVFLVTGASKAEIVGEIINADKKTDFYPAQAVCPTNGEVSWFVDEAAARLCSTSNSSNTGAGSDLLNKNP
jgi:6-phosphogluconolactonase